jgi:hypothetical protein
MPDIVDQAGTKIAEIALSERQLTMLDHGMVITIFYHTPQLLRGVLGAHNGSFVLRKEGEHIIADDVDAIRKYADLQAAIKAARET